MTPVLDEDRERDPDGHLTDEAVAALVDAQPLSHAAVAHGESCEACSARIAEAALAAVEIHQGLADLASAPMRAERSLSAPPVAKPQRPALYIAAALAVAALASLPTAAALPGQATGFAAGAKLQVEGWSQIARALEGQIDGPLWSLLLSLLFVALGVMVAVWGTKRERGTKHGFA